MNFYVIVEGRVSENVVYKSWIPEINPALTYVSNINDVTANNFVIFSGNGYPAYFDMIQAGLEDVSTSNIFDRLVICVDSEEMGLAQKKTEIEQFVLGTGITGVDCRIVVQHFCFEAWALGNRRIGARNPKNPVLADYKKKFDVCRLDPELLPDHPEESLTRNKFAGKYLRLMLNDKYKGLTYSKSNPSVVAHPAYYRQLKRRLDDTGHISSFSQFVGAFH